MTATLMLPETEERTRYGVTAARVDDPFSPPTRIAIPRSPASDFADFPTMARDLQRWTNWSDRRLGEALGTTHPTIAALLAGTGQLGTRNREYLLRLGQAHEIVRRIFEVAGRDPQRTAMALEAGRPGESALLYLAAGKPQKAYLRALEALQPRTRGRLRGSRSAVPGEGRIDYLEPDRR